MVGNSIRRGAAIIDVVSKPVFAFWYRVYTWSRWLFTNARFEPAEYKNVLVSIGSSAERYPVLRMTLKTLFLQKARPEKVLLWVTYQDMLKIPEEIWEMEELGLEVNVLKESNNIKNSTKNLKKYRDWVVIEAADDEYYPANWLASLMKNSEQPRQHYHWSWAWH